MILGRGGSFSAQMMLTQVALPVENYPNGEQESRNPKLSNGPHITWHARCSLKADFTPNARLQGRELQNFFQSPTASHPCPGSDPAPACATRVLIPQLLHFLRRPMSIPPYFAFHA